MRTISRRRVFGVLGAGGIVATWLRVGWPDRAVRVFPLPDGTPSPESGTEHISVIRTA